MPKSIKIGIVEFHGHRSDVEYLVQVLTQNFDLFVVAKQSICDRLNIRDVRSYPLIEYPDISVLTAVNNEQPDIIIACTITPDARQWKNLLALGTPIIALVHNTNWQLSPKPIWKSPSLISVARRLRWWLRGDLNARLKLTNKLAGLVFPSPDIEAYAKQFTAKPTLGIQWAIGIKEMHFTPNKSSLKISIPGGVDFGFRDYSILFEALKVLKSEAKIHLNFLGAPTNPADKEQLKSLLSNSSKNISYTTHNSYVPTEEYQSSLAESDVILIAHKGDVHYAEQLEQGGLSKVSGAENDQVRAGKPAIVSSAYKGMAHLSSWQTSYSNAQQLAEIIENFHLAKFSSINHIHSTFEFQQDQWSQYIKNILRPSTST